MNNKLVYLDHAAATPIDERVLACMQPYFTESFFNPSSPYAPAVAVRRQYEAAKTRIASSIGAKPEQVTITAGATESINLAFFATTGHVVTSAIEHQAVLEAAKLRSHTIVEVLESGIVEAESVKKAIQSDTQLISIALANNEIGTIQPLKKLAKVVESVRRERRDDKNTTPLYLHVDGSQGTGQIDVNVARLGVDMLTLNAGKIYGPKQVGLLWAKRGVSIRPMLVGGGQESGLRSGTENVAGVIGFAKALEIAQKHRKQEAARLGKLRDTLQARLETEFSNMIVTGNQKKRLPGHLHVSFPGLDGERIVFVLEASNILLATGSACSASSNEPSHVLKAIGLSDSAANGSLRMTLGKLTDEHAMSEATEIIIDSIKKEYKRTGTAV